MAGRSVRARLLVRQNCWVRSVPASGGALQSADIVIVGGGIVGTSMAAALAGKDPSVVLLEKDRIGAGASGQAQGLLLPSDDPVLGTLFERTAVILEQLVEEGPDDCDLDPDPIEMMLVALDRTNVEALEEAAASYAMAHVAVERLSRDDAIGIEPLLSTEIRSGLLIPGTRRVSAEGVTAGLARVAAERGAEIHTGVSVRRILLDRVGDPPEVRGVVTDTDAIETRCVVDATGPWAALVARSAGSHLSVSSARGWTLLTERLDSPLRAVLMEAVYTQMLGGSRTHRLPTVGSLAQADGSTGEGVPTISASVVPARSGGVALGATESTTISSYPYGTEAIGLIARRVARLVPTLAGTPVTWSWTGLRPVTPDERPLLGAVASVKGLWVAAGHGSKGISTGPASGEAVAAAILGVSSPVDLTPFRPDRFETPMSV